MSRAIHPLPQCALMAWRLVKVQGQLLPLLPYGLEIILWNLWTRTRSCWSKFQKCRLIYPWNWIELCKSRFPSWIAHWGQRMGDMSLGRPRRWWEDNIRIDLSKIASGSVDWMHLAQNRKQWRALANTVMKLRVPKQERNFLRQRDWLRTDWLTDWLKLEDSSRGSSKGHFREGQVKKTPVQDQAKKTPERVKWWRLEQRVDKRGQTRPPVREDAPWHQPHNCLTSGLESQRGSRPRRTDRLTD
jgi:hypothetical protein